MKWSLLEIFFLIEGFPHPWKCQQFSGKKQKFSLVPLFSDLNILIYMSVFISICFFKKYFFKVGSQKKFSEKNVYRYKFIDMKYVLL